MAARFHEWDSSTEPVPQSVYDGLVAEVQKLDRKNPERKRLGDLVLTLKPRVRKAERQPGEDG